MLVKTIHIRNFRSILDEKVDCEQLTSLVGPNGAGKSTVLRALEVFYSANPKYDLQDFYHEDVSSDIEIEITFSDLDKAEKEQFQSYLQGETLTVVRVLSLKDGKSSHKYHGSSLQNPDFAPVREATKATEKKTAYVTLSQQYTDLPKWTKTEDAISALKDWEAQHSVQCTRHRDDGQFFGFVEVGQGYLGRHTRFIYIPAVRDAALDAADGKGTPITELMDLVVRKALADSVEVKNLREVTQARYQEIMDPEKLAELPELEKQLTTTLKNYVPDAGIELSWLKTGEIEIPMPKASVKVVEDGYASAVTRAGHGLQRAFIMTLLQHLAVEHGRESIPKEEGNGNAADNAEKRAAANAPSLLLGIEEPELYQHPNRQRHLAQIFLQLTRGEIPGVARRTQVIYTTHSPLFVGIDRFDQVRRLTKAPNGNDKPKKTTVARTSLDEIAEILWEASDRKDRHGAACPKFTGDTLRPRLQTLMTPWMAEGFFADVAVLVEGEDDRAAIIGMGLMMGHSFESKGISIIPCGGKENLDRPAVIFRMFGIPVYVVWDSDSQDTSNAEGQVKTNRRLLRLMKSTIEDYPDSVSNAHACFKTKLETVMQNEIGKDLFEGLLASAQQEFSYTDKNSAIKSPVVLRCILEMAHKKGRPCKTLQSIVTKVLELKR